MLVRTVIGRMITLLFRRTFYETFFVMGVILHDFQTSYSVARASVKFAMLGTD